MNYGIFRYTMRNDSERIRVNLHFFAMNKYRVAQLLDAEYNKWYTRIIEGYLVVDGDPIFFELAEIR